jgi:F-type H+-transporting ATPase subunit c
MADIATAITVGCAMIGGGLALAGGAIGTSNGNATAGAAVINSVTRQPEARSRIIPSWFLTVGLVEAPYFINLAFMVVFVYVVANGGG